MLVLVWEEGDVEAVGMWDGMWWDVDPLARLDATGLQHHFNS